MSESAYIFRREEWPEGGYLDGVPIYGVYLRATNERIGGIVKTTQRDWDAYRGDDRDPDSEGELTFAGRGYDREHAADLIAGVSS